MLSNKNFFLPVHGVLKPLFCFDFLSFFIFIFWNSRRIPIANRGKSRLEFFYHSFMKIGTAENYKEQFTNQL